MYKTLIVADDTAELPPLSNLIHFGDYLSDYPKLGEPRTRVINLCDTERYLSRGYYCSLLAESRQHQVLPSVSTINDLRIAAQDGEGLQLTASGLGKHVPEGPWPKRLEIFFGWTAEEPWRRLAKTINDRFPSPILVAIVDQSAPVLSVQVERGSLSQLCGDSQTAFLERLEQFTQQVWRAPARKVSHRWEMALLYDEEEATSPSNSGAIQRFVKAAGKVGIAVEVVRSEQLRNLAEYDALFIRETTRIDHLTYRLARRAEREGLVVIDDPASILRCCNKIFLHDAFSYKGVQAPRTKVISGCGDEALAELEAEFDYPMVLKMPESSFSSGVHKAKDRVELAEYLKKMLQESSLLLVQEYIYTDFDWRIGVLNGRAIYACKYYMARDHWQIYNHGSKDESTGGFETMPTFEVPRPVLEAALKACGVIGKGLYGVDIKQVGEKVYVIEVNDNPSIEHGVEDAYLGDELYMMIMQEFVNRLELRGRSG